MAVQPLGAVVRHLRKLASAQTVQRLPDGQLLRSFIVERDETAFSELMNRHGRLVLSVCRQVLRQEQDAEDAFQATFLILAKKAESIRNRESLASWLYGVAYRTAMKAKISAAKQCPPMNGVPPMPPPEPPHEVALRELQELLHEEVNRLPEKLRAPFVLCCLEGKSQAEAARQLGWPGGTVGGRLAQARERLRQRLARRGLTFSAVLGASALSSQAASAAVPAALADTTIHAALLLITGKAIGTVSAQVLSLALGATAVSNLKSGGTLALAVVILATGVGLAARLCRPEPAARVEPARAGTNMARAGDYHESGRAGMQATPKTGGIGLPPHPTRAHGRERRAEEQVRADRYGDPLPAGAIARVGTVRLRHGSQVYCLAFSPDGSLIASGSYHGDLCLWDRTTGKLVRRLADPSSVDSIPWVSAVAFSPDGKILASNKGKARLWEVRSGKLLSDPDRNLVGAVGSMPFSHDGKTLVLGTQKGIRFYDLATGKASEPIPGYTAPVTAAVFSKNGKVLASGSTDKTARIWDLVTGQEIHRFEANDRVVEVALAPDGRLLAAQTTKEVFLWEVATGREARRFQAERYFRSLAFSPDGTRLASANVVWDVTTGKEICRLDGVPSTGMAWGSDGKTLVPVTGGFQMISGPLAFAPDGTVLATGGYDGVIRLHDPVSGKELPQAANTPWNRGRMAVCGFDPGGRWLAVRDNGGIHLCETTSGKEIHHFPMGDDYGVSVASPIPVALSPDSRLLVAAGAKAIYRWDTVTGKELGRTPNPRKWEDLGPTAALAFAPDGRTFACAHYEPIIRLWDTMTGKQLGPLDSDENGFLQLFFSPDGKKLVSETLNHTIQFWDLATRKELDSWSLPFGRVQAFSPDGRTVAVGGPLILCDLASGRELRRFDGIKANFCAFSPDGRLLAVDTDPWYIPDRERTIQVLEVASGNVRARFAGHFGFPEQMMFSPDGKMLAAGGSDSTALIWDVTGGLSE